MKKRTFLLMACICASAAIVGCSGKTDTVSSNSVGTNSVTESVSNNATESNTTSNDTNNEPNDSTETTTTETTPSIEITEVDGEEMVVVPSDELIRDNDSNIICKLGSYSITYATAESDIFVLETTEKDTTAATFITNNKTSDECAMRLYTSSDSFASDGSLYEAVSSSEKLTDNNGNDYFVLTDSADGVYIKFIAYVDSKDIIVVSSTTSAMLDAITISK